jgi:hypothetical protein
MGSRTSVAPFHNTLVANQIVVITLMNVVYATVARLPAYLHPYRYKRSSDELATTAYVPVDSI